MSALQSIDESLFRLLNAKVANPVFDVLMPFLSGNKLFVPAVILVVLLLLWRGGAKGRIYVLMVTILLSLGDPFVCNQLKHYFQRPRPFVTLPDVHQPPGYKKAAPKMETTPAETRSQPGKPSYGFPSAHAFNWGALAMLTFIFYRRSWQFMVPLALAVAYSRIYNGVHYPGDVAAGLLIGAVYSFSGVVTLTALWNWIGKILFPVWHSRLSNLTRPKLEPATNVPQSALDQQWLRLGYVFIAAIFVARLIYLASGTIQLSEDEAYQWLWSKHLALSYYSKPFGIALAQWIGTHIWGDTEFGIRFLSPVLGLVLSITLLRFITRRTDGRTGFMFTLLSLAVPLLAAGGVVMMIDPLVVFFWTLAMLAAWRAIETDSTKWWLLAGLCLGAEFLCKYFSPFQWASFALFFLLCKPACAQLRRPGPWLALGLNLLASIPVVIWNSQHHWITLRHLSERSGLEKKWQPTLKFFFEFIGGEFGLLNPILVIAVLWAIVAFGRSLRDKSAQARPLELFLFAQGIVILTTYTLLSFKSRVQLNWIAPCIVPLLLFATLWWHRRWMEGSRAPAWFISLGLLIGLPIVIAGHNTDLLEKPAPGIMRALRSASPSAAERLGKLQPGRIDPLHQLRGRDQFAAHVAAQRTELAKEGKPVFIIADHYGRAGLLNFYLPEARPLVQGDSLVTMHRTEKPGNQLWFWPGYDYASRTGQNAIYVVETDDQQTAPEWLTQDFASVTDLGMFDIEYHGRNYNRIQLFACRGKK